MDTTNIQLIDNTAPAERATDDLARGFSRTTTSTSTGSRLRNRPSIRAERAKRKYAKWQPDRLGVAPSNGVEADQPSSSDEGGLLRAGTMTNTLTNTSTIQEGVSSDHTNGYQSDSQALFEQNNTEQIQQQDFGAGAGNTSGSESGNGTTHQSKNHPDVCGLKPGSELDILYENQRGWFFLGIPLYSNQSLLNIDPPSWVNASGKRSFVNITNAQVPDPSWEWAWKNWYVDMSGDVDEQGWRYAFSFSLSSSWHGTHPFWNSFVRRRRWVRLRVKKVAPTERPRRSRTGLEMGHTLNEDYFTIHTGVRKKRASSSERASRTMSVDLGRSATDKEADEGVDEIRNIPALMHAIKAAIVDREKFDTVRKFIDGGGEELYYLEGKIPEIMSRLVYQTSRWQLLAYLNDIIQNISQQQQDQEPNEQTMSEAESHRRKHEYLSRAADTAERHLAGPEVFHEPNVDEGAQQAPTTTELFNLTPRNRRDSLLSRVSGRSSFQPMDNGGEIRGIPAKAEIGHDFHIY